MYTEKELTKALAVLNDIRQEGHYFYCVGHTPLQLKQVLQMVGSLVTEKLAVMYGEKRDSET